MAKKFYYTTFLMKLFWGSKDGDKRRQEMVKLEFFQNCPFWTCVKKFNTFTFWCMIIPLVNYQTMDVGPSSHTMDKDHLPWSAWSMV